MKLAVIQGCHYICLVAGSAVNYSSLKSAVIQGCHFNPEPNRRFSRHFQLLVSCTYTVSQKEPLNVVKVKGKLSQPGIAIKQQKKERNN